MALVGKREDLIHVPWASTEEWLQVYKQIYSGDLDEQNKAYETLLVWKARISKLPVGVECTLGLIQVCLRDREWNPKILSGEVPITYENDLRMMYSTAIMKFLNHISNIAHNKQASLFVIAKQLNIPDWIVDLRHNTAHGHELPSADVMRIVANILLTWLHEEYWAAEAHNLQELQDLELSSEDEKRLIDMIELWTALGLYIRTNHNLISDLPDTEMGDTLRKLYDELNKSNRNGSNGQNLSINLETESSSVSKQLLSEIIKNVNKGNCHSRREQLVIDCILNNEAFLTNSDILAIFIDEGSNENTKNCLPLGLIDFWKDFLLFLQDKKLLLMLFLELIELIKKEKDTNKKIIASLWVKTIAQAFHKQKITRHIFQILEQKMDSNGKKLQPQDFLKAVYNEVDRCYPELKNVLNLNVNGYFPLCLTEESFVKRLILTFNEFSEHYIPEVLKMTSFLGSDTDAKKKLLRLIKVTSVADESEAMTVDESKQVDKIFTIEDIKQMQIQKKKESGKKKSTNSKVLFGDNEIRNTNWTIEKDNYDWSACPIGILPWQTDDFQPIDPLTISSSEVRYAIVKNVELPKIIDSNKLKTHSKIQWENLLKKKKKSKKKVKASVASTSMLNKAVESVKSAKEQDIVS